MSAVAAARVNAALALIEARFDQPELTVATVAQSLCISSRYLQRLFEMTGTSFTARVNDLRLERAFALLTDSPSKADRISHVALQAGFSDVSHFNRNFKRRYGASPSEIRARHD